MTNSNNRDENPASSVAPIDRLLALMARLRDVRKGCPWDLEQTFATIAPHTIEEAYEVADAIERADMAALRDELGDLLFQVVFHARMAEEAGAFDFDTIVDAITDKMVSRHPHVFGDETITSAGRMTVRWEELKDEERRSKTDDGSTPGILDGLTLGLPALMRAQKIQKRVARVGFDWDDLAQVRAKIDEELAELDAATTIQDREDELGDVLFAVVNLARHLGLDAEAALRRTNTKFKRRFSEVEKGLRAKGLTPDEAGLDRMEELWQKAKTTAGTSRGS